MRYQSNIAEVTIKNGKPVVCMKQNRLLPFFLNYKKINKKYELRKSQKLRFESNLQTKMK